MASNESEVAADFYDIDSLLSRSTKVACTYSSNTPREVYELLGTYAPHYTDEKGYKVLTPFWFVRALEPFCSVRRGLSICTFSYEMHRTFDYFEKALVTFNWWLRLFLAWGTTTHGPIDFARCPCIRGLKRKKV
ncbi:hypothetical protein GCK32_009524 [Trichostrongylus colubriformis]|uniref:Uncharacterized protein n=1 Tax=Trichostrongylus colubriformis TaxID=6319 RepID=A0AAN8EY04_TRICO